MAHADALGVSWAEAQECAVAVQGDPYIPAVGRDGYGVAAGVDPLHDASGRRVTDKTTVAGARREHETRGI
jgi:hypothetical protein